jgi:hypothetical protein
MGSTNIPDRIDADAQTNITVSAELLDIQIDKSDAFFIFIVDMLFS